VISLLPIPPASLLPSRHLAVLDVSSLPCIALEIPTVWSHCLGEATMTDLPNHHRRSKRPIPRCPKLLGTIGAIFKDSEMELELAAGPPSPRSLGTRLSRCKEP
jgi:hypothetical protein